MPHADVGVSLLAVGLGCWVVLDMVGGLLLLAAALFRIIFGLRTERIPMND